ncbi:hypothetical protein HaLaN_05050, partial [Haematococcus lacustris]
EVAEGYRRLAEELAAWWQAALQRPGTVRLDKSRVVAHAAASCAWGLAALLHINHPNHHGGQGDGLPPELSSLLAVAVLERRGRLPHILSAEDALRLAAALVGAPGVRSYASGITMGRGTASIDGYGEEGGAQVGGRVRLAVRQLLRQTCAQAGLLGPQGLALLYTGLAAAGSVVVAEACASQVAGSRSRQTESLLMRLARLVRIKITAFRPREFAAILAALAVMYSRHGVTQPLLLLDEVARAAINKLCNASSQQVILIMQSLAALRWYSSGAWERAARGPLTHLATDMVAAMSMRQLEQLAAAYAAVGHHSPLLEARVAELLSLAAHQDASGDADAEELDEQYLERQLDLAAVRQARG